MEAVVLTGHERGELERIARSQKGAAALARRARVILALAPGETYVSICNRSDCGELYVSRWKRRFLDDRISGLLSRHVGQPARTLTPKLEAKVLNATRKPPADGSTHWSTRRLGSHLGISHMLVARIWTKLDCGRTAWIGTWPRMM